MIRIAMADDDEVFLKKIEKYVEKYQGEHGEEIETTLFSDAKELIEGYTPRFDIIILDEPTDGLHLDDIRRLMKLFNKMTDQGNTLFIIEHSLDVMKDADYIVELGPEGGQAGGEILFTGTPKEMLESSGSVTREYLSD